MGRLRAALHTLADLELAPDGELLTRLDALVQCLAAQAPARYRDTEGVQVCEVIPPALRNRGRDGLGPPTGEAGACAWWRSSRRAGAAATGSGARASGPGPSLTGQAGPVMWNVRTLTA
ncbi:hypothetical protein [Streptomyces bullii]|uniref:Uncharacterized protein n=1 Tax=Streptomyces bullii TaxID=349910 RepID=A0ABW0V291_9ACTN